MDAVVFSQRLLGATAVLVQVVAVEGSAPRESGAWMGVFPNEIVGTVGGGQLELQAMAEARRLLAAPDDANGPQTRRYPLGPSLGQCCGGVVFLQFRRVTAADAQVLAIELAAPCTPVALFGGGHVGQALARVLARLPFALTWIDSRDQIFPSPLPPAVQADHCDPVQAAVPGLAPGSCVLVMSFSHAEDLDVIAACLRRQRERGDLPYIGLIGSRTKWATFRHRLAERGFSDAELGAVVCPIGLPSIAGKEAEVIAVSVAAQLLQHVRAPRA